jgi:putative DNA-invertase from lambdoid prophage Rac
MSRVFAYSRCSTADQVTENQFIEIESKGFDIPDYRKVSEIVSGGVQAFKREEFSKLISKMEPEDTLVVSKLDRLGRDNIDVQQTIMALSEMNITVISLDLSDTDLTSSEGKLMLQIFSAFAEFERSRIADRTRAGLARAKKNNIMLGRPEATETTKAVQLEKAKGLSQSKVAEALGVSLPTVKRHWNKVVESN